MVLLLGPNWPAAVDEWSKDMSSDSVEHHEVVLESGRSADLGAVIALLSASGLPTADIEPHIESFVIARSHGRLIGTVGFENYGDLGLLRSLCVEESHRGQGTGRSLLSAIEAVMSTQGVREVYLLTAAAARYFETEGFATIPRDQAPDEIRQTTEFRSLCPSSAICMRRSLSHVARYVSRALLPLREDIPGARMWAVRLQQTMMTYFEIEAGVRFETHQHAGEQITTVIDGELFFEIPHGVSRLGPGDVIAIPPNIPHAVFTATHFARAFDSWSPPFPR